MEFGLSLFSGKCFAESFPSETVEVAETGPGRIEKYAG